MTQLNPYGDIAEVTTAATRLRAAERALREAHAVELVSRHTAITAATRAALTGDPLNLDGPAQSVVDNDAAATLKSARVEVGAAVVDTLRNDLHRARLRNVTQASAVLQTALEALLDEANTLITGPLATVHGVGDALDQDQGPAWKELQDLVQRYGALRLQWISVQHPHDPAMGSPAPEERRQLATLWDALGPVAQVTDVISIRFNVQGEVQRVKAWPSLDREPIAHLRWVVEHRGLEPWLPSLPRLVHADAQVHSMIERADLDLRQPDDGPPQQPRGGMWNSGGVTA